MENCSNPRLRSLLADRAVMDEMSGKKSIAESLESTADTEVERLLSGDVASMTGSGLNQTEAIILLHGRPALLVQDGRWEDPGSAVIAQRLAHPLLSSAIQRVGRMEILDDSREHVGTGWMIDEGLLVTNRHVAELFAERSGKGFGFRFRPSGGRYEARVDFLREHGRSRLHQTRIEEIVLLEESGSLHPDMALMRLATDGVPLPAPIELDDSSLRFDGANRLHVAVIGYPAEDSRNNSFEMSRILRDIYNVKRLSPGQLMGVRPDGKLLEHDCTTLGGNSGSVVINLTNGKACGLHFAGSYCERNYAVTALWLKRRLATLSERLIVVPRAQPSLQAEAAPSLTNRGGYDSAFLGDGNEHRVALPTLAEDLQPLIASVQGNDFGELTYTHFSIVMRSDRRLPFFTAVNIDGGKLFNFPRGKDSWYLDPRLLDQGHQIGPELYTSNSLDRGHLVRRLDPAWGETRAEAKQAEVDSFFYTNASPQHCKLNQRTWLSLEEHVLTNAETHGLRVSVFTGPVFGDEDIPYRGVRIPSEYWKVMVIVNERHGSISATGYILSQADFVGEIEFVFGEFKTYQVAITVIENKTGLSFALNEFDPIGRTEGPPAREIRSAADLHL